MEPPKRAPAPLLLTNGFTDDVFWADQVLVYYNLLRSLYPTAPVQLLFGDIGHQRAQSKPADLALASSRIKAFLDYYVKGAGPQPATDVTALTQTCPKSAPSGGPYTAATWAALHPGVVRLQLQTAPDDPVHRWRSQGLQGVRPGFRRPFLHDRACGR